MQSPWNVVGEGYIETQSGLMGTTECSGEGYIYIKGGLNGNHLTNVDLLPLLKSKEVGTPRGKA
jgi:hypothetical protein